MKRPTHAYIGRCPHCNGAMASSADLPEWRKETAKGVAQMIRDGLIVGREEFGTVGIMIDGCNCAREKAEALTMPLFEEQAGT